MVSRLKVELTGSAADYAVETRGTRKHRSQGRLPGGELFTGASPAASPGPGAMTTCQLFQWTDGLKDGRMNKWIES